MYEIRYKNNNYIVCLQVLCVNLSNLCCLKAFYKLFTFILK